MTTTYEQQLDVVQSLEQARSDDDRHIDWCVPGAPVGLARDPRGRIEIFLEGPELHARFQRVRAATEHQQWYRADGDELLASRILLPAAGHYEQVAAFLCTELLRNGAEDDLPRAFAETEPLIELAIADLLMGDESLLGLTGELLVLQSLLHVADDEPLRALIDAWKGYRDTARDFQVGLVGVEVKTTTGQTSSHQFSGVHQMELGHGVDAAEETGFMVLSLGLEWVGDDELNSTAIPELIGSIEGHLRVALGRSADAIIDDFIDRIAHYGSPTSLGYDHRTMSGSARFNRRLRLAFARGYDMTDPAIHLLTSDDLRSRPFIDRDSLHLRVNLPATVTGDINPIEGLSSCTQEILRNAGPVR